MSEFKGTKGKWYFENPGNYNLARLVSDSGQEVCNFGNSYDYYPTEGEEPNQYDALLISKAPEMLEVLQRIVRIYEDDFGNIPIKEIEQLIKEATDVK